MRSPWRAWDARAARASAAGGGARRPVGREELRRLFYSTPAPGAPERAARVGGAHGRACAATPWRGDRARLKRGWLAQTLARLCSRTGALGGTTGTWTFPQARRALVRTAMAALAPGGRGQRERGRASIIGSAPLCFSRWTQRRGRQLY